MIDADALIDAYCNGCTHYRDKICRSAQRCDFESFCNEYINTMPTVDAVPVKRGEWVEYPYCLCYEGALTEEDIACSSCGAVFNVIDNCTETFKYCPNCGARMDERKEE